MVAVALTIAGSDPSGGAGLQGDLKTFHAHGVYGEAVVSLLTVQNTRGVLRVEPVSAEWIAAQLEALWDDLPPRAAKTGALASVSALEAVAESFRTRRCPLVVDPVFSASLGHAFASEDVVRALPTTLLPVCALVTPNAPEAERLTGIAVEDVASAERAARALLDLGAQAALVKGGHLPGAPVDVLACRDGTRLVLSGERVHTQHTHGTGCTYAAAITARLARGADLVSAVSGAKAWLSRILRHPLGLGSGRGPLNHLLTADD
jgi:hydroxymethylpyrimidine/phosphomethylpyrimidine kinase